MLSDVSNSMLYLTAAPSGKFAGPSLCYAIQCPKCRTILGFGRCQPLQVLRGVRVVSSKPHEWLPCLCQSCLCRLLLVVAGEPSGAGWNINSLLHHKVSVVDVPPNLFSAAVSCVMAKAEVGVVLSVLFKTLPASHTLKYTNRIQKR